MDGGALGDGAARHALARSQHQAAHDVGVLAVGGDRVERAALALVAEHGGAARAHEPVDAARQ